MVSLNFIYQDIKKWYMTSFISVFLVYLNVGVITLIPEKAKNIKNILN